jgi:ABC-type dipeptide/oligopeptide/nickel transport system permease component
MIRFVLRRLAFLPFALLLANFAGFAYAHFALYLQQRRNPFFAPLEKPGPIFPSYWAYLQKALQLDFGILPIGVGQPISEVVASAVAASLGLLAAAFLLSLVIGLALGFRAARVDPPAVAAWLAPLSTVGLAMPSFYVGTLFVIGVLNYRLRFGPDAPGLPVSGFGWDLHLVLPVLALMLRPAVQVAQVTASLLSGEFGKRYIVTARAAGNPWRVIRWKHALRNVMAPVILTLAASFRLLMGELVVVEWLFAWPGLGRLLARILLPSQGSHLEESMYFLHPSALAATLTAFALFFLLADLLASVLVRAIDPRLRAADSEAR